MQNTIVINGITYTRNDSIAKDEKTSFNEKIETAFKPVIFLKEVLNRGSKNLDWEIAYFERLREIARIFHLVHNDYQNNHLRLLEVKIGWIERNRLTEYSTNGKTFHVFADKLKTILDQFQPQFDKVWEELRNVFTDSVQVSNEKKLLLELVIPNCRYSHTFEKFRKYSFQTTEMIPFAQKIIDIDKQIVAATLPLFEEIESFFTKGIENMYNEYIIGKVKGMTLEDWKDLSTSSKHFR